MVRAEGTSILIPVDTMKKSHAEDVTDEFIVPTVCNKDGKIKLEIA